jgi:hypothetical protein
MNPDSPSSIRSESPIPSNPTSPISVDDEFSRILDPDREYQPPRFEVMPVYRQGEPMVLDDADSVQTKSLPDEQLLMEHAKFSGFVNRCVQKCIENINTDGVENIPTSQADRDEYFRSIIVNAYESGFFGEVYFLNTLIAILINFKHRVNIKTCIATVLDGYNISFFQSASNSFLVNLNKYNKYTYEELCQQVCILILTRELVNHLGPKLEFSAIINECVKTCIENINANGVENIPTNTAERDQYFGLFIVNAYQDSFFGKVNFLNNLIAILLNFKDQVEFILENYHTSVFEPASHWFLVNLNKYSYELLCQQVCILILTRELVKTISKSEFTYFGKARRDSIKTVNKDIKMVKCDIKYLLSV